MLVKKSTTNMYLAIQETEEGWDYTTYTFQKKEMDGGVLLINKEAADLVSAAECLLKQLGWEDSGDTSIDYEDFMEEVCEIEQTLITLPEAFGLPRGKESLLKKGMLIHCDGYSIDTDTGTLEDLYLAMRESYLNAPMGNEDMSYLSDTEAIKYTGETVELWRIELLESPEPVSAETEDITFAILWGQYSVQQMTVKDGALAKVMNDYEDDEISLLISSWTEQCNQSKPSDITAFFESKLDGLLLRDYLIKDEHWDETEYAEPQIFLPLRNEQSIEIVLEQEGLEAKDYFYSIRLHCSEKELDRYHKTLGVIDSCSLPDADVNQMLDALEKIMSQHELFLADDFCN